VRFKYTTSKVPFRGWLWATTALTCDAVLTVEGPKERLEWYHVLTLVLTLRALQETKNGGFTTVFCDVL